MVVSRGPSEIIPEEDLLRRLLADYGVSEVGENGRSEFVDRHIQALESSDNEVIARTGFVLKRAAEGYGLGYKVPLALLAMGRAMLGIDFAVAAPFISANPVAFTCAAAGAVYYGYAALGDDERTQLHARIAGAFQFGIELVKGLADFFITTMRSVFDSDLLKQMKACLADAATAAGTSLYAITGSLRDRASAVADSALATASWFVNSTNEAVQTATGEAAKVKKAYWDKGTDSI